MDFASLMKAQIASSPESSRDGGGTGKKYLKRSEVEAQRREAYLKEQEESERARSDRLNKKRRREDEDAERHRAQKEKKARLAEESRRLREEGKAAEDAARRKRLGLPELVAKNDSGEVDVILQGGEDMAEEQLKQELMELGEPRVLFGESHAQRLRRLRALTKETNTVQLSAGPIPTSLQLVEERMMKVPRTLPNGVDERLYLHRQLASYFDLVLSQWETALTRRSQDVKESFTGKQAYNSYNAALSNLRPLFRKLEANDLPDDVLKPIVEIVDLAQRNRYVDANDAYLRLSIGNTAWPIGVTMVGIHERSAREKLHEDGSAAAHIMSDEGTRKMIQGIKRALTFAQTRWPPDELGQLMG